VVLQTQVVSSKDQGVRNTIQGVRNSVQGVRNSAQGVINRPLVVIKTDNPNVFNEPVQNALSWDAEMKM
jgi:hypothetical protein